MAWYTIRVPKPSSLWINTPMKPLCTLAVQKTHCLWIIIYGVKQLQNSQSINLAYAKPRTTQWLSREPESGTYIPCSLKLFRAVYAWYKVLTFFSVRAAFNTFSCARVCVRGHLMIAAASVRQNMLSTESAGNDFNSWHTAYKHNKLHLCINLY